MTQLNVACMRRVEAAYRAALQPLRLSPSQAAIMQFLYTSPLLKPTIIHIADSTGYSFGTVSREISTLERRGFVVTRYARNPAATAGKVRLTKLTPKGWSIKGDLLKALQRAEADADVILKGK